MKSPVPSIPYEYFNNGKTETAELVRRFSNVQQKGDEIWGQFTYDAGEPVEDTDGELTFAKRRTDVEFVIINSEPQYLIALKKATVARPLVTTINDGIITSVGIIRPAKLSGMNFKEFLTKNPSKSVWAWMPLPERGATMFGASGPDLANSPRFKQLLNSCADLDTVTANLREYDWTICLSKKGTILIFTAVQASDGIAFLREKILPLM